MLHVDGQRPARSRPWEARSTARLMHVLELAHVAGPAGAEQRSRASSVSRTRPEPEPRCAADVAEVRGQERDVLAPLAQRRAPGAGRPLRRWYRSARKRPRLRPPPAGRGWWPPACARPPVPGSRARRAGSRPAASTRSSLGCSASGSSPISSRKSVPPSATSNLPARSRVAPVKAPGDVAEQLALGDRLGQRGAVDVDQRPRRAEPEAAWIWRATSSLPTPVSPVMSTARSEPATSSISLAQPAHGRAVAEDLAAAAAPRCAAARARPRRARSARCSRASISAVVRIAAPASAPSVARKPRVERDRTRAGRARPPSARRPPRRPR